MFLVLAIGEIKMCNIVIDDLFQTINHALPQVFGIRLLFSNMTFSLTSK